MNVDFVQARKTRRNATLARRRGAIVKTRYGRRFSFVSSIIIVCISPSRESLCGSVSYVYRTMGLRDCTYIIGKRARERDGYDKS